jgi:hypothetical protein
MSHLRHHLTDFDLIWYWEAKVKFSVYLSTTQWRLTGSGGMALRTLNLSTTYRWVASFTLRPLYPRENSSRYHLDRRLGGPQSRSGSGGEEKWLFRANFILVPNGTKLTLTSHEALIRYQRFSQTFVIVRKVVTRDKIYVLLSLQLLFETFFDIASI